MTHRLHRLLPHRPGDKAAKTQEYESDAAIGRLRVVSRVVDLHEALATWMRRAMWLLMRVVEEADQGSSSAESTVTAHSFEVEVVILYH